MSQERGGLIKKVATDKLRVGMYIHDLDASWLKHPFLSNHFAVNSETMIRRIIDSGIRHVYIDTSRGGDIADAVPLAEVEREIESVRQQVAFEQVGLIKHVTFDREINRARSIMRETNRQVRTLMEDVRFGRQIDTGTVHTLVEDITSSVFRNQDALINLTRIKQRDQYTFQHSVSVCVLMTAFAKAMGFELEQIREVAIGALLHDIGKMRLPHEVLAKQSRLTDDEFELVKGHVAVGGELLARLETLSETSLNIVMEHHERIDGTGYPSKLVGNQISQAGQMAAIVDVYDALTSERCYKKAWEPTHALGKMLEWSRHHFDEKLVHQFVRCVGIYPVGTLVRLDSGMIAVVVEQSEENMLLPRVRIVFDETRRHYITPCDLDLQQQNSAAKIVAAVSATEVQIDAQAFL